ncbi:hypothetical protein FJ208_01205 [Candidatus Gribaldobacteria bacterium]|nr:hypothetical protein [Candidatus Gribaldobacteria bacterium]
MKLGYTLKFQESFSCFNEKDKRKFYQKADYLLTSIRHPSLRAKKYDETRGIWQARVSRDLRFYFLIEGNVYILLDIKHHPKS